MGQKLSKRKRKELRHLVPFLDVEVNIEPDDRCSISGITCLNEGRIIATDYLGRMVKYYDTKMLKLIDFLRTDSSPYEVCKSDKNDNEVYVSLPFENRFIYLSIRENKMAVLSSTTTDGMCYGIASCKAGMVVSVRTDQHEWQIELLDETGAILHVLKHDKYGRKLFGYPDYITMDTEGSQLCVSDGLQNTVTSLCLNSSSNFVFSVNFVYRDKALLTPKGITLDGQGDLLVVGCESNNVHKVSKSGQKMGVVLDGREEIVTPMGIYYDNNERKIYITEGSRKVMIFKELKMCQ